MGRIFGDSYFSRQCFSDKERDTRGTKLLGRAHDSPRMGTIRGIYGRGTMQRHSFGTQHKN